MNPKTRFGANSAASLHQLVGQCVAQGGSTQRLHRTKRFNPGGLWFTMDNGQHVAMQGTSNLLRNLSGLLLILCCCLPVSGVHSAERFSWRVEGAPEPLRDNILLHLQAIASPNGGTTQQRDNLLERELQQAVVRAGRALGYYALTFTWQRNETDIAIQVTPRDPVRWHTTELSLQGEGASEPLLLAVQENHPFVAGKTINQASYDDFKRRWLNQARSLGYRDARYTQSTLALHLENKTANVILSLQTGEPYTVTAVRFEGSQIHDDLLQRLALIKPGDRFQAAELAGLYGQLLDTGYFEDISVLPVNEGPGQIAIEVSLVDAAQHTFTTGVGFSTDTGPRLRLGWNMPLISAHGHQWHSEARVSEIEQQVSTEYRIPISNPLNHYLSFDAGWRHKDVEDTETRVWQTSVAHHSIHGGWQHTYKVGIEDETYRQGDEPTDEVFYVIPGASWSRTRLKGDPNLPDGGHKLWLGVEASTVTLGSDTDFLRLVTGARWFTLLAQRHEVHARLELGVVEAGQYEDVPPSRRFFTGGDQTVRGYDFESLAPKDDDGDLIGGRYLNVAGVEYRWRWKPRWFVALFSDFGRAYNETAAPFNQGAGVGLHWQSPVGPIRFDIATPVNNEEHDGIRLHLTMGAAL